MCVICCFSLAAFNICSLCLIFVNLIRMYLGVFHLGFILFGTLCVSWTWVIISFPILGKFSTIISSVRIESPVYVQCRKVKSESEVAQSYPTLSDPTNCSPPGFSIYGIFQARVLEWGAIAFSPNFALEGISKICCMSEQQRKPGVP